MSALKRNDPCHCGSGKKYKKCHYLVDRALDNERSQNREAGKFLRRDFLRFVRDERFAISFAKALSFYWNNHYEMDNAEEMSMPEALRFTDWFVFDYGYETEEGETVRLIELYKEQEWDELSIYQQKVLDGWIEAMPASSYVLTDVQGTKLHLRDILSGEEVVVHEGSGKGDADIGDVILARLVPLNDSLEFSTNAAYLPQDEIADLPDKLKAAKEKFQEENPDATYADFLRSHHHIAIHHALEQAELKGRPPVARVNPERDDKATQMAARAMQKFKRYKRR